MTKGEGEGDAGREILRLEDELTRASVEADVAALDRMYADDVMVATPFGVMDKSAVMAEFHQVAGKAAAGLARLDNHSMLNAEARVYGDTAVTSYDLSVAGQYEGRALSQRFRIMNVWMKRALAGSRQTDGHRRGAWTVADGKARQS
ncbi:MAG TPA: nuclear transport factor 2 family protein [Pyrinomonadaceae bacterium]|nr:nuclear transport factor 2 family protein [Pyrinomonadaceae bacterium]